MANFALLNLDNVIINIIEVDNKDILDSNGKESEEIGIQFCSSIIPGKWMRVSDDSKFIKNIPTIGFSYDKQRNAFIPPKPYPSWIFNEETCQWQSPVPNKYEEYFKEYRRIGASLVWDEINQKWIYRGPKIYSKQDLLNLPPPPSGDNKIPDMGYLDFTGIYPGD
jgi:hypothetical protein